MYGSYVLSPWVGLCVHRIQWLPGSFDGCVFTIPPIVLVRVWLRIREIMWSYGSMRGLCAVLLACLMLYHMYIMPGAFSL